MSTEKKIADYKNNKSLLCSVVLGGTIFLRFIKFLDFVLYGDELKWKRVKGEKESGEEDERVGKAMRRKDVIPWRGTKTTKSVGCGLHCFNPRIFFWVMQPLDALISCCALEHEYTLCKVPYKYSVGLLKFIIYE